MRPPRVGEIICDVMYWYVYMGAHASTTGESRCNALGGICSSVGHGYVHAGTMLARASLAVESLSDWVATRGRLFVIMEPSVDPVMLMCMVAIARTA
jgi:hypothetical protein